MLSQLRSSRSRKAVSSSKQGSFMADHHHQQITLTSPAQSPTKLSSSFSISPRIFNGLLSRAQAQNQESNSLIRESNTLGMSISPKSILGHPFGHDPTQIPSPVTRPELGVGLALIGSENRGVLFASNLKVKIPNLISPADFGIKTPRSSPSPAAAPAESPPLSLSEMEQSEDYTCVITHGPNPKTTHIFDNCVVENCCGVMKLSELKTENGSLTLSDDQQASSSSSENFLRFCDCCNVNLSHGRDIYMYRGERAFCSHECRNEEMLLEELKTNQEMHYDDDDVVDDVL